MTIPDISSLSILNMGIIASLFGGLIYSLKSVPGKIITKIKQHYIFKVIIYDYDELFYVLEEWLYRNYQKKYRSVEASYVQTPDYYKKAVDDRDNDTKTKRGVIYKQDVNIFIIKYKGKRLVFNKSKEKIESSRDTKKLYSYHYAISGFMAKAHIQEILEKITQEYNKSKEDKGVKIYVSAWGEWNFHSRREVKPLSDTILNENDKRLLINDINTFQDRKSWYRDINLFYKRTYLFYGPPGTGKTTLSFAIAAETKRPIYVLSLGSIPTDELLIQLFSSLEKGSVLLIEDIDAAFVKREASENKGVSFSCVLNCIDGAFSKDDIITIITTNHIEKLDPALIRAGRVDIKMEIPKASNKEISEFLTLFYEKPITIKNDIHVPISEIQEMCIRNTNDPEKTVNQIENIKSKIEDDR